jgi:hypothetical protein
VLSASQAKDIFTAYSKLKSNPIGKLAASALELTINPELLNDFSHSVDYLPLLTDTAKTHVKKFINYFSAFGRIIKNT